MQQTMIERLRLFYLNVDQTALIAALDTVLDRSQSFYFAGRQAEYCRFRRL